MGDGLSTIPKPITLPGVDPTTLVAAMLVLRRPRLDDILVAVPNGPVTLW